MAQKCTLFREELRLDGYKLMDNCPVCLIDGVNLLVGKHKSEKDNVIIQQPINDGMIMN